MVDVPDIQEEKVITEIKGPEKEPPQEVAPEPQKDVLNETKNFTNNTAALLIAKGKVSGIIKDPKLKNMFLKNDKGSNENTVFSQVT